MRICIVTIAVPVHGLGGMQDHTHDLACGLTAAGHEVEVITSRHPRGLQEVEEDGVLWRFVDAPGHHLRREWLRASADAFAAAAAADPYDLVHGEGSSALALLQRGVHRRVPVVNMFHGNFVGLAKAAGSRARRGHALVEMRHLARLAADHFPQGNWWRFRQCEAIVPSQQQLVDTCRAHLLDPRRVHVVPNGVDTSVFRPRRREEVRAELRLPVEAPVVVAAGRLNREKGFGIAVRALARLSSRSARLAIVGDGEERSRLERLAAELDVSDRVSFEGARPHHELAAYMAAADAFVFPTERDEAAPLVLPQAMACGVPVVAAARGGIPEVVDRPGENGLLVPAGDVAALASAVDAVLGDGRLASRLGAGARRRVGERYTLEQMVAGTLDVYEVARAAAGAKVA